MSNIGFGIFLFILFLVIVGGGFGLVYYFLLRCKTSDVCKNSCGVIDDGCGGNITCKPCCKPKTKEEECKICTQKTYNDGCGNTLNCNLQCPDSSSKIFYIRYKKPIQDTGDCIHYNRNKTVQANLQNKKDYDPTKINPQNISLIANGKGYSKIQGKQIIQTGNAMQAVCYGIPPQTRFRCNDRNVDKCYTYDG